MARARRWARYRGHGYLLIVHLPECDPDDEGECTCRPHRLLVRP